MALDDEGMQNQYLTKLRVMIREDADILRELTEMLRDFAYSYNAQLEQAGQVDGMPKQPVGIVHGGVVPKGTR